MQVVVGHGHLETDKGRSVDEEEERLGQEAPVPHAQQQSGAHKRILRQQRVRRFELLKLSPVVEVEEENEPESEEEAAELEDLASGVDLASMRPQPVALRGGAWRPEQIAMVCKPESAEGGWEDFGGSVSCDAEAHTSMMENAIPKVARKMITTKFLAIFSDKILVVSMAFALGSIAADGAPGATAFYPQHPRVLLLPTCTVK